VGIKMLKKRLKTAIFSLKISFSPQNGPQAPQKSEIFIFYQR
jgi:hypothetical protein